jgi:hypothetical protein
VPSEWTRYVQTGFGQSLRSRFIDLPDRDHYAVGARNLGEHTRARPCRQSLRNGAQLGRIPSRPSGGSEVHLCAPFNLEFVLMPDQRLAFAGDSPSCLLSVGIFRDCLNLDSQHYATDPDLEYVPVKDLLDKVY